MRTRMQILLSTALLVSAAGVLYEYTARNRNAAQQAATAQNQGAPAASQSGAKTIRIDADHAQRIGVTYATAHYSRLKRAVRAVGIITYDERRLVNVNPKIEGWVEHLYVNYTGAPVRKGEPLLAVYSPMLVSAQEELILARRLVDEQAQRAGRDTVDAQELLSAARRRLAYWDVGADQISQIERSGVPNKAVIMRSPANGVVTEKNVVEGMRIMPGMDVFKIADVSRVWIDGEVFEKDIPLVKLGQAAEVTLDSYPGQTFHGSVTFIYPGISLESRTGRARIELPNPDLRLKPGMYATVDLRVDQTASALVVPRTAVMTTGERSLAFVLHEDRMLMPHNVKPGQVVGDSMQVLDGLWSGAKVVSSASFLVDAESNLAAALKAMPGMDMGPEPSTSGAAGVTRAKGK